MGVTPDVTANKGVTYMRMIFMDYRIFCNISHTLNDNVGLYPSGSLTVLKLGLHSGTKNDI